MSENNLTYCCQICITDFSNEGVTPFQCLHVLCNDCNKQFKNSTSKYKCPLCKSNVKKNSQYYIDYQLTDEYQFHLSVVRNGWASLSSFDHQTDEMCKIAIQRDGCELEFVHNQTDELCELAVKKEGYALQFVHNQTDEICKLAVQQNGWALEYVHNQTDEICKLAVQQNGYALDYVHNQTDEICKLAVQTSGYGILHWLKKNR